jgi:hypothetical protein
MKKWLLLAVAVALAVPVSGALLPAQMRELGFTGLIDFDSAAGTLFDFGVFFGYFFTDGFEMGLEAAVRNDDLADFWSTGVRAEYNFDLGTALVPYLGLSLSYGEVDSDVIRDTGSAAILGGQAGVKYFLTEYLALSAALVLQGATDEVFPNDDEVETTNSEVQFGIRCFF